MAVVEMTQERFTSQRDEILREVDSVRAQVTSLAQHIEQVKRDKEAAKAEYEMCFDAGDAQGMAAALALIRSVNEDRDAAAAAITTGEWEEKLGALRTKREALAQAGLPVFREVEKAAKKQAEAAGEGLQRAYSLLACIDGAIEKAAGVVKAAIQSCTPAETPGEPGEAK